MLKKIFKIIKNPYSFSLISKVFCVLVGVLFTVFQSRFLGAEIKGQVATVNSILSISSIVFSLGICQAYPYFKRTSSVDVMPIFLKLAVFFLVFYWTISFVIVIWLDISLKYIAVLLITPLLVYDGLISDITVVESPNKKHVTDVLVMVGELLLVVILWLTASPNLFLGILVITVKDITKGVIFTFWWRKRIFISTESIWKWVPKLVRFGFFPTLSLLMSTLNYRLDVLMLNGNVPDAAIGIYSVGVLLAERVWLIPEAMKGVMLSKITKGKDAKETAYVIRICNSLCLCLIFFIIVLGKPFVTLFFGIEYQGAYSITVILLIGVFSMIYYKLIASYNIAMGKQIVSFTLLTIAVLLNVITNYIMIPLMGIYGAAVASVISYSLCAIMFIAYFCTTTKTHIKTMLFVNRNDLSALKGVLLRNNAD